MEKVVGFHNTGVICWFNSLLQCLLSSHYFVNTIKLLKSDNEIVKSLQLLISSVEGSSEQVHSSSAILRALLVALRDKEPKRFKALASGQQCSAEGFTLLLDYIDDKTLNSVFNHRYEEQVVWVSNSDKVESKIISHNNQFEIFDEAGLKANGLSEYIRYNETPIDEYKSERADADTAPDKKYKRLYILRYLPKVVVLLLNRYYKKARNISLPEEFTIPSCQFDGNLVYKKIAEVDHMGSPSSGHYVSKVLRKNIAYMCNDATHVPYRLGTSPNTYMTFYEYSRDI